MTLSRYKSERELFLLKRKEQLYRQLRFYQKFKKKPLKKQHWHTITTVKMFMCMIEKELQEIRNI